MKRNSGLPLFEATSECAPFFSSRFMHKLHLASFIIEFARDATFAHLENSEKAALKTNNFSKRHKEKNKQSFF